MLRKVLYYSLLFNKVYSFCSSCSSCLFFQIKKGGTGRVDQKAVNAAAAASAAAADEAGKNKSSFSLFFDCEKHVH